VVRLLLQYTTLLRNELLHQCHPSRVRIQHFPTTHGAALPRGNGYSTRYILVLRPLQNAFLFHPPPRTPYRHWIRNDSGIKYQRCQIRRSLIAVVACSTKPSFPHFLPSKQHRRNFETGSSCSDANWRWSNWWNHRFGRVQSG
jgi:hypothetical protein